MTELSADRARELLNYDPDTGRFTWRVNRGRLAAGAPAGSTRKDGYVVLVVDRVKLLAHRVAWLMSHGVMPEGDVDHINGQPGDNRLDNLRDVSRRDNLQNRRTPQSSSKTGRLGVTWDKRTGRWKSAIRVDGRCKHLGRFDDIEVAAAAYLAAKRIHHPGCTI